MKTTVESPLVSLQVLTRLSVAISPLFSLPQARQSACLMILTKSPSLLSASSTGRRALILRPGRPVGPGPHLLGDSPDEREDTEQED